MLKSSKIALLCLSTVLVVSVFAGLRSPGMSVAAAQEDGNAYRQIDVYSEVLRHIQADYVTVPNIPEVTDGALRGLLESLDADSSYLSPADYKVYKSEKVKGVGRAQVGMNVSKRYGYATVVSTVSGGPAEKAGLTDGDILEAIDGHDTRDLSLAVIQLMLEGQPGTQVAVSVVRPRKAAPDKLELTRAVVPMPAVSETVYDGGSILYLKPVTLDREHVSMIESKVKAGEKSGTRKVLLDLRDVSTGDMDEATRLANLFLKTGTIATLEGQTVTKMTYTAEPKLAIDPVAPMVVLVNRGTAGPGELVAAALLDDKRAELVGEKTFGEGTQQKTFELPDGAALILSVAKYGSPSGKKLQDDGVTPGVLVAANFDDGSDDGSDDATDSTKTTAPAKPAVTVDDQLTKALDLLKAKTA
jgi:carboxyl-terminal processing protease